MAIQEGPIIMQLTNNLFVIKVLSMDSEPGPGSDYIFVHDRTMQQQPLEIFANF